ncbi:MAG: tetratricopeptide repeat protein, partial [Gemmatimonadaceae bacterium]
AIMVLLGAVWHERNSVTSPRSRPTPSNHIVAVLPFTVYGAGTDSASLSDGLAELLSHDLDGAGDFRSADSRAIASFESANHITPDNASGARVLAEQFSAGSFVLGDVARAGGMLRLTANLYGTGDSASPAASAQVEGDSLQLLRLVDQLAEVLLGKTTARPGEPLAPVAARTTSSIPALKAYLRGEALFRDAQYAPAVDALQRAVAADSQFALAWYRLGVAADWAGDYKGSIRAAERAYQLRDRLSGHERLLLDGYRSWRVGDMDRAEHDYRELLRWNPASMEAWYELGEVLFHGNGVRGRATAEAGREFERVIAADPDDRSSLTHLMRIVALLGDTAAVDSISGRLLALEQPGEARLDVAVFRAVALHDSAAEARLLPAVAGASDQFLIDCSERLAVFTGNLDAASRVAMLLEQPQHSAGSRVVGYANEAQDDLAQGRWRDASRAFDGAEQAGSATALHERAYFASTPFAAVSRAELVAMRDTIARERDRALTAELTTDGSLQITLFEPLTRWYVLGLLNARLGDTSATLRDADAVVHAAARAQRLGARAEFRVGDVDGPAEYARSIAASLRGIVAAAGGRHEQAVALLEQSRPR